jgi:hypothetical protein
MKQVTDVNYEAMLCTAYNPSVFTTKMQKYTLMRETYKITVTNPKALKEIHKHTKITSRATKNYYMNIIILKIYWHNTLRVIIPRIFME